MAYRPILHSCQKYNTAFYNTNLVSVQYRIDVVSKVHYPIFKSDLHGFNCTIPHVLPRVFYETDSVSLRADAQECVFSSKFPRAGTGQYHP